MINIMFWNMVSFQTWWLSLIWAPNIIYDIYQLNLTMSCQQMEKSAINYHVNNCAFSPNSRGAFYPKYHTFTHYLVI